MNGSDETAVVQKSIPAIDVHGHYVPSFYRKALEDANQMQMDGVPVPDWNPQKQLEMMDQMNIAVAMLSISSPGLYFGDSIATRELTRKCNEYGAELVRDYPRRLGLLAALPLPDVDGSLAEIAYAIDVLHADGIKLATHSGGMYLGDERMEPVFVELSRRQAVVVLHPTKPSAIPENVLVDWPISMMEFLFDTTRAMTNMIMSRTLLRNPGFKLILPHAGAFMPLLADRLTGRRQAFVPVDRAAEAPDIHEALRKAYYDMAGYPVPGQLWALLQMVGAGHLLYGSDWPHTPDSKACKLQQKLLTTDLLTEEDRRAVFYENALGLFPRLAQIAISAA
jgi:predicted TIM-barrel fold metal-dependent hydrolase